MPCVAFEPTITASERTKTVHALDRSATVTGIPPFTKPKYLLLCSQDLTPVIYAELNYTNPQPNVLFI
jgi:hypothetical protein